MSETRRLPYIPKGAWLEERYVRCGKQCRCQEDQPHGTYWRLCWRERRRGRRQRYVAEENLAAYREALALRRQEEKERRRFFAGVRLVLKSARNAYREAGRKLKAERRPHQRL